MSLTSLYTLYITDNLFTALIWGLIEERVIAWTQDLGRLKSVGCRESDTTEHPFTHTAEVVQFCISGGVLLMINLYSFRKALT